MSKLKSLLAALRRTWRAWFGDPTRCALCGAVLRTNESFTCTRCLEEVG